jgi:hypothetical protein
MITPMLDRSESRRALKIIKEDDRWFWSPGAISLESSDIFEITALEVAYSGGREMALDRSRYYIDQQFCVEVNGWTTTIIVF